MNRKWAAKQPLRWLVGDPRSTDGGEGAGWIVTGQPGTPQHDDVTRLGRAHRWDNWDQEKANCAWGEQAAQPMPAETAVIFDAFCPDGAFMYVTGTG